MSRWASPAGGHEGTVTAKMSQRARQAPAGSSAGPTGDSRLTRDSRAAGDSRLTGHNHPARDRRAAGDSRPGPEEAAAGAPAAVRPAGPTGIRLTGRGALLGIFVLCFLGLLVSVWLGWGPLAGVAFVLATGFAAARTQRTDLLTVTVSPPALFLVALMCVKGLTASGNVLLSTATGTLITLANTAPWLLAGTGLSLIIAFTRGLRGNVVALGQELRGAPAAPSRRPGDPGSQRPSV
jgi:hypothetical protein